MTGFAGTQDGSVGDIVLKGGLRVKYDPTLDSLGYPKRCYIFDSRHIFLEKMEGEWRHKFTPARPNNQFVVYKSLTCTGQLVAQQVNGAGVYDIN
jgi:hypothetical protein